MKAAKQMKPEPMNEEQTMTFGIATPVKLLFIGAHCDDIELGCGGTIHKLHKRYDIHTLTLSPRSLMGGRYDKGTSLSPIQTKALESLGVKNIDFGNIETRHFWQERQLVYSTIRCYIENLKIRYVFCHEADEHQDHETVFKEVCRFRDINIFTYSLRRFPGNFIVPLSDQNLVAKTFALSHYDQYYHDKPYWGRAIDLARATTMQTKYRYAESFNVVRMSDWSFGDIDLTPLPEAL